MTTTSGQGNAVFSFDAFLTDALPKAARPFEKAMHGGFHEDSSTGIVYTGMPGYGLCQISPDLKQWNKISNDPKLEGNIHGLVVFRHNDTTFIACAMNDDQSILICNLNGTVLQEITKPTGNEFAFQAANDYYTKYKDVESVSHDYDSLPDKVVQKYHVQSGTFSCTDVTYCRENQKLYVVTGYCPGDFVLTLEEHDGVWQWGSTAWGGKGDALGQFRTAHGIFAHEKYIYVANREAKEVLQFTIDGTMLQILQGIPDGSRVCNISHAKHHNYFLINPLAPIHKNQSSAPIYAWTVEDQVISTIVPGDLGIPVLKHVHHVWPHYLPSGELTLMVHGWNKGKYAVLRHVPSLGKI